MTQEEKEPEEKFEYGTKEEAQRRYDEKVARINTTMCPLRDNTCRRSCVCFEPLKVVNKGTQETPFWICKGGFCTAYCLVGPT